MKYVFSLKASGAFVLLIILVTSINGLAQSTPNPKEVSAHIGKNTPVILTPDPIRAGHSYQFKTYNPLDIKVKVIVARKKPGGGYEVLGSHTLNAKECKEMSPIPSSKDEEWFVAVKCKAKILIYNNIEKIEIQQVDECTPAHADSRFGPIPTRAGVQGRTGTTTTSTTTMVER